MRQCTIFYYACGIIIVAKYLCDYYKDPVWPIRWRTKDLATNGDGREREPRERARGLLLSPHGLDWLRLMARLKQRGTRLRPRLENLTKCSATTLLRVPNRSPRCFYPSEQYTSLRDYFFDCTKAFFSRENHQEPRYSLVFHSWNAVTRLGKRSGRAPVLDGTYQFSMFYRTFDNCQVSKDKREQRLSWQTWVEIGSSISRISLKFIEKIKICHEYKKKYASNIKKNILK